jgi:euchromatic histone-lysine N-methyltransferase
VREQTRARPDLAALGDLKGRVQKEVGRRLGHISGIPIGATFVERCELAAAGLHAHWLNGIDSLEHKLSSSSPSEARSAPNPAKARVASSIVMAGGYEDDVDHGDTFTYTGQGGNNLTGDKRQIADQELKLGNLALHNAMKFGTPVRVIRGVQDSRDKKSLPTGKRNLTVYTYDGLYNCVAARQETGKSGWAIWRFDMRRVDGESAAPEKPVLFKGGYKFKNDMLDAEGRRLDGKTRRTELMPRPPKLGKRAAHSRTVHGMTRAMLDAAKADNVAWAARLLARPGLLCTDVSGEREGVAVPVFNEVDDEPCPEFKYTCSQA